MCNISREMQNLLQVFRTIINKNMHFNLISKLKICLRKDDTVLITCKIFLSNADVIINKHGTQEILTF